jgi:hypothetical protein
MQIALAIFLKPQQRTVFQRILCDKRGIIYIVALVHDYRLQNNLNPSFIDSVVRTHEYKTVYLVNR